jgi:hypothetical protein
MKAMSCSRETHIPRYRQISLSCCAQPGTASSPPGPTFTDRWNDYDIPTFIRRGIRPAWREVGGMSGRAIP